MGQSGSLKVRDRSLLLSFGCLSVADSLLEEPESTQTHHVCMCVYMSVFLFPCFELWLQEVSGLQPVAQGLPDSPSLQWVGILPVDYHIISIALASHYCDAAWLAFFRRVIDSRSAPSSPLKLLYYSATLSSSSHFHSLHLTAIPPLLHT